MIASDAQVEEQQYETSFSEAGTSSQNEVAIPSSNGVANISRSSSSDDSLANDDFDERQVAEIQPQIPMGNGAKIINTYTGCEGINSTVKYTTVIQDGATINQNIYCCPSSLDNVLKQCTASPRYIVYTASVLSISLIIFLSLWMSNLKMAMQQNNAKNATNSTLRTKENIPRKTTPIMPLIFGIPTSSTFEISTSTDSLTSSTDIMNNDWKIVKRKGWGAARSYNPPVSLYSLPPLYVIFCETETKSCTTTADCKKIVLNIQAAQMRDGFDDIAYNFLIGGDGMIYEGRGWDVYPNTKGYHTQYFIDLSIRVSFIGKFDNDVPTESILQTAKNFLKFGTQNNKLVEHPGLKCFKQLSFTSKNPGDKLYNILKTWKGWDNRSVETLPYE